MRRLPFAVLLIGLLPLACAHVVPPDNDSPLQTTGGQGGTAGEGGQAGDGGTAGTTTGGQTGAGTGGVSGKGGTGGTGGASGKAGAGGTSGGAAGTPGGAGGAGGEQAGAGGSPLSGCGAKTIKINEFAVAGPNGANDEFIELYNGGTCAVALDGWVIKYSSKSGSSPSNRWTGTSKDSIESGAYFVLGTSDFAGAKDVTLMAGMSGDGGGIGLYSTDGAKTPLDSVAWKTATASNPMAEGDPCENPDDSHSAARHHDGEDTDDNSADFDASASPSPGQAN